MPPKKVVLREGTGVDWGGGIPSASRMGWHRFRSVKGTLRDSGAAARPR